jgi:FMN phosphatase YigB (HAD superfamily)
VDWWLEGEQRCRAVDLIDVWCISDEVGVRKPEPRIFHRAVKRCGLTCHVDGWMIGDSLPMDITGGHAAGLRTAWITQPHLAEMATQTGPGFFTGPAPDIVGRSVPGVLSVDAPSIVQFLVRQLRRHHANGHVLRGPAELGQDA